VSNKFQNNILQIFDSSNSLVLDLCDQLLIFDCFFFYAFTITDFDIIYNNQNFLFAEVSLQYFKTKKSGVSVFLLFFYSTLYDQRDAINTLKHSLIGQFVKFFWLINQMLQSTYSESLTALCFTRVKLAPNIRKK